MEICSRDKIWFVFFTFMFLLAATHRAILFGEQYREHFTEHYVEHSNDVNEQIEVSWNWTLFAKKGFHIIDQSENRFSSTNRIFWIETRIRIIITPSIPVVIWIGKVF